MKKLHQINKLDEMLIYLNSLHPKYIDFNLNRIKRLMKKLDNPEKKLPLVVHIAGTNGKGSTLSFMKHIAEEYGLKVNCYLSPHLIKFNERIVINGQIIADKLLFKMLKEVAIKNNNAKITFFEITTAVAFLAFSKFKSDLCIIETGLGGKLDATNILEKKNIVALTKIGFDHKEFLGRTLRQITLEKCGILKKSTPVVIGQQRSKYVENLILKEAKIKQAPQIKRFCIPKNWKLGLSGDHQYNNAEIAVTVMRTIYKDIKCSTIKKGLYKTQWPGRLQTISNGKLFSERQKITLIDGAHNIDGAIVINDHLKTLNAGKWTIILGMMNNKDVINFIKKIEKQTDMVFLTPIENQINSFSATQLSKKLKRFDFKTMNFNTLEQAISRAPKDKPLLITGSLYLIGKILEKN